MKRIVLSLGSLLILSIFCPKAKAQVYDLNCPTPTTVYTPLVFRNLQTGNLKANACLDSTGLLTWQGSNNPFKLGAEIYASGLPGATCGDKINVAIALFPSNGGTVKINQACGTGTAASPWTAITTSLNFVTLDFIESGNYFSSGITLNGVGSGIRGLPCASPTSVGLQCPVHITEGNSKNLTALITFGGGYNSCREIVLDGNNTNNPTGGVVLKVPNNSPRYSIDHCATQNAATHGIWVSGGAGNTSCCGKINNSMESNNNGDAVLIQESSDIYMAYTENEGFGINPIVNTVNTAVSSCAANCVTWVSGPKWSTDISLVGTAVRLNNVSGQMFYISSIQSQTLLSLTTAPGTQNGIQMNNGNAVENRNGGAMRVIGGEISSTNRGIDGLLAECGGGNGSGQIIVDGVAFGNTNQHDIEFLGSDPANQTIQCMFGNVVVGNKFSGGAVRTPDNTYDNIFVQDGGQHVLGPNIYTTNTSPNRAKYAIQLTETASGRASINSVSGVINTGYGTGSYIDSNLNKSGFVLTDPTDGSNNLQGFVNVGSACIVFAVSGNQSCILPAASGAAVNATIPNLTGTIPGPIFSSTGTGLTGAPHSVQDTATLAAGTVTVTFTGSAIFTSATSYTCVADDDTAIAATRVLQNSGSSITITGTGTDVIRYICIGN